MGNCKLRLATCNAQSTEDRGRNAERAYVILRLAVIVKTHFLAFVVLRTLDLVHSSLCFRFSLSCDSALG